MNATKNRKVVGRLLLHGPLGGEEARVKGYSLNLPASEPPMSDVLGDPFCALVDDELYARIEASGGEGVLVPIELPCVFLSEIRTRAEAQALGEGEVICEAWEIGATMGRRAYLGHALYSSYAAAASHNASADADVCQDPSGIRFDFGGIWRARGDEATMANLRSLSGGPLFPQSHDDPEEPTVPFDHWCGGDREPT